MSSNTGANPLNWITLPFEDVPFDGPRLLFDINFVTPSPRGRSSDFAWLPLL